MADSGLNQRALDLLEEIHGLMQLKGENPFKVRAFENAIQNLSDQDDLLKRAQAGTLTEIIGIGKGISEVLTEFLLHGKSTVRDALVAALPVGLVELTQVPGLGPKKALKIIEELDVHSLSELEYACRENRLLKLPGFGEKIQDKVLEGILFLCAGLGQRKLSDAMGLSEVVLKVLKEAAPGVRVSEAGALRRRMEVLSELDYVVECKDGEKFENRVRKQLSDYANPNLKSFPLRLFFANPERFGYELALRTGSDEHWKALGAPAPFDAADEEQFYSKLGYAFPPPPETRESGEELTLLKAGKLKTLITGVRGVFHNHTTRSDGVATLEQMVFASKKLGYEYIGISDHSQSAFYAQGLKTDTLLEQQKEIRQVQEKYPEIKIFWGIESDILADGSLDYDAEILKKFDFVIGSIHSRFKMDRETMTQRILEAIRNPAIRFLGHATGRLLLGRKGYDLDMEKIIEEASKQNVAIELNSHPARLDIDWRWGSELRKNKTMISINPDAHEVAGLEDTQYGIAMARKALMPAELVLNSRSTREVANWLKRG